MCLNLLKGVNCYEHIKYYKLKPKDFAELLGVSEKHYSVGIEKEL